MGSLRGEGIKVGLVHCGLPFNVFGQAGVSRLITGKRVKSTLGCLKQEGSNPFVLKALVNDINSFVVLLSWVSRDTPYMLGFQTAEALEGLG